MASEESQSESSAHLVRRRGGFTLSELLIVMAIIVLALTLAVPAIRALTGTRSEQAAQNTLSAFLSRARTEAIGLQKVEGVLFFIDPATNRVTCAQVMEVPPTIPPPNYFDRDGIVYLDLAPDHDTLSFPPGVLPMTIKDSYPPGTANPQNSGMYPMHRYLGFNDGVTNPSAANNYMGNPNKLGGVILFDAEGRAISRSYGLHLIDVSPINGALSISALGQLAGFTTLPQPRSDWPSYGLNGQWLHSQLMLVLLDREAFDAQFGVNAEINDPNPNTQQMKEQWIDQNTTPIFVNRYSGTLTRAG